MHHVFNTSEIYLLSGTCSAETDFPLHGVSLIFAIWNDDIFVVNIHFKFQV